MPKSKTAAASPPPPEPIPQEILSDAFSEDPQKHLAALQYIDKYLNRHQQAANRFVICSGILPLLFDIIRNNDRDKPELLYTAAVCVSCISAGSEDETLIVQEASLIHPIYAIFDSKYDEAWDYRIKAQIGLIIGNIAGNNVPSRDYILEECDGYEQILRRLKEFTTQVESMNNAIKEKTQYIKIQKKQKAAQPMATTDIPSISSVEDVPVDEVDAFPPLSDIGEEEVKPATNDNTDSKSDGDSSNDPDKDIKLPPAMEYQKHKLAYVRTLLWTMSNYYRWSPRPRTHESVNRCPLIRYIIWFWDLTDFEIKRDLAWLLAYITDIDGQNMKLVIKQGQLLKKIHECLMSNQSMSNSNYIDILHPILRIYGNFASGSDEQTDILLKHNFLQLAENLMKSPAAVPKIQQEICFIVSNVLVGSPHQRRAVLESSIMRYIVSVLLTAPTDKVRKEAVWAIGSLLRDEITSVQVDQLSDQFFPQAAQAYQDTIRLFLLRAISCAQSEGYPNAAKGMICQLTNQQNRLSFFFDDEKRLLL